MNIITGILISGLPMDKRGGEIRIEAKTKKIGKPHGIDSGLDQVIQHLIISVQD